MANRKAAAALAESSGDALSADEAALMSDNQAAENSQPEAVETAPEPVIETVPETDESDTEVELTPEARARKVDYGALHAERKKRQAADAKAAKLAEDFAKLTGRLDVLQQVAQQSQTKQSEGTKPVEIVIPDVNADPVGHFQAKAAKLERELGEVNQWRQQQTDQQAQYQNVQRLTQIALSHESEFSKKTPDYQEAAAYVRNVRDQELQAMGYVDPQARQQIINQDALQIAAQALQNNMNAAEVVYNISKARGWQPKAKPVETAPAPASDIKKLVTVANGQKQESPISQANGSAPAPMSVDALLKMSDADFEKATRGDDWRKLFA